MTAPYISIFENRHGIDVAVLSENDSVVDYWQRVGDYNPSNPQHYLTDACLPYPFAAAPELLAVLKRMREVFEQLSDGDWRHMDATYVDQLIDSDGLLGCDRAIAKAEGRSE